MSLENRKIAVIGLGAIGKNHFRALARLAGPNEYYLVDPILASEIGDDLSEEVQNGHGHGISFGRSMDILPAELDLAVIATRADVRLSVLEALLDQSKVHHLILEKVLFQKLDEYEKAGLLLNASGTRSWVHHTRRAYPFYADLAYKMKEDQNIRVEVTGGNWGIGCNGLHFLDLFQYLTGSQNFDLDLGELEPRIVPSKRAGIKEVIGTVRAKTGSGHAFSMTSYDYDFPLEVKVSSRQRSLLLDEANGWVRYRGAENKWQVEIREEPIVHYISEFTNRIAESIFTTGDCKLPTYTESSELHILFLRQLMTHFSSVQNEPCTVCPIT